MSEYKIKVDNLIEKKPTFTSSTSELITAILSYLIGYLYIQYGFYEEPIALVFLSLLIIGCTIYLNRNKRITLEKGFWLGCVLLLTISLSFDLSDAFERGKVFLLLHLSIGQFVLSFSETQLQRRFDTYIAIDALHIFVTIPFKNFVLRSRTILYHLLHRERKNEKKEIDFLQILITFAVIILFLMAFTYILQADSNYAGRLRNLWQSFFFNDNVFEITFKLIMSIPVGGYLCGMINGSYRESREKLDEEKTKIDIQIENSAKIKAGFWNGTTIAFTVLYMSFFVFEFSYLFGAFSGLVPENMLISEYAREGFFELCKIMCINFVLLILASITTIVLQRGEWFRITKLILLGQSILFAITALSKLILYIATFGFTPLRLQSFWLILTLLGGCICWIIHLINERKYFRSWAMAALAVLCIMNCIPFNLFLK